MSNVWLLYIYIYIYIYARYGCKWNVELHTAVTCDLFNQHEAHLSASASMHQKALQPSFLDLYICTCNIFYYIIIKDLVFVSRIAISIQLFGRVRRCYLISIESITNRRRHCILPFAASDAAAAAATEVYMAKGDTGDWWKRTFIRQWWWRSLYYSGVLQLLYLSVTSEHCVSYVRACI